MVKKASIILLDAYLARRPDLKRFFIAMLGPRASEADDLLQDLFLKVSAGEHPDEITNPGGYLYRLASNLMTDRIRQQRRALQRDSDWRRSHHLTSPAEDVADLPAADAAVAARQRLKALMTAVDLLPPQTQRVFRMHKFDGLSYGETAAKLGISRSAVEKHMTIALRRLSEFDPAKDGGS